MEQKELIAEVKAALGKGHHVKAAKLAKGIMNETVKDDLLVAAAKAKDLLGMEAKKAEAPAPKKVKKAEASNEEVLKQYDRLIDLLAEMDVQRRNIGKPYRVYFFHRRQIENLRRSFVKGTR